jgi:hypothetical protein
VKNDMKNHNVPRVPTTEEKEALAQNVLWRSVEYMPSEEDLQEVRVMIAGAYIAVFDNYITSTVGYAGKMMIVVWDAGLEYYELYAWRPDGSLFRRRQSSEWFELFTPEE